MRHQFSVFLFDRVCLQLSFHQAVFIFLVSGIEGRPVGDYILLVGVGALGAILFSSALPVVPYHRLEVCYPLPLPQGLLELDLQPLFSDLRILGDEAGNRDFVLKAGCEF